MSKTVLTGAAAALTMAVLSAGGAHAATITTCTGAAATIIASPTVISCTVVSGNALSGSNISEAKTALSSLGFTWNGTTTYDANAGLGGATTINLSTPITGLTFFGIHFGNSSPIGQATAFYEVNAGKGVSQIKLNSSVTGSSNFEVFNIGSPTGVPEPATWGMMVVGLGMTGAAMRASRRQAQLA